jgi:AAA domain
MQLLPVEPAHRLGTQPQENRWLIDGLWGEESVGVIGAEPKSFKSFLALDMAVAVASGAPCLRRFAVPRPGRVLLFAAEDAPHVVRQRLEGIAHVSGVALHEIDIQVITAPYLWLDDSDHVDRLYHTVKTLKPRLLVLDPFVRLHGRDENASSAIAPLLALLRELQRNFHLAVVLVHHAKKGGGRLRPGQALRGTSEFHAWADSMLYLRRKDDTLSLFAEHRAAVGIGPISLQLRADDKALALEIVESQPGPEPQQRLPPAERIHAVLAAASAPLSLSQLRQTCRLRKATVCQVLAELTQRGKVQKTSEGYRVDNP